MPKKIDAAVKARALRMFAEHRQDYARTPLLRRRWRRRSGSVGRPLDAEIKRLRAEVKKLREDNQILKAATVFFAGELDPRNR
jgi:transposase